MPSQSLLNAAERVMALAKEKRLTLVTAESCTSGLLAAVLSEAPGAAELLHGGFVTYTKCHKTIALGVPEALLTRKGAVCPEVAAAMAQGALARSAADLATAITGVAGPSPDEDGNPVGTRMSGGRAPRISDCSHLQGIWRHRTRRNAGRRRWFRRRPRTVRPSIARPSLANGEADRAPGHERVTLV